MKKQWKRITGMVLALALILTCIPTMEANAATAITGMPAQTIAMNEFDTITFTANVPVVAKIQLKTKGTFSLRFNPDDPGYVYVELYDAQSNLLAYDTIDTDYYNITPYKIGYNGDLDAGTYYLRMYNTYSGCDGTYSFQAQMYPAAGTDILICPTIKKGKTLQLSPSFINCKDKKLTWKSSNKKVATVSSTGKVKALKKGTTTIKVYNLSGVVTKLKIKVV